MVTNRSIFRLSQRTSERYTNMGQRPALKQKVKAMIRRKEALNLVGQGLPITVVADRLSLTVQSVRRHLRAALASDSLFPNTLGPEQVAELRQLQAEILGNSRQKAIETHAAVAARIGTPEEKNMDATASARLLEAVVRSIEMEANLFGTKQPTKIIEQSLRVNLTKVDNRVVVHLDRDQLKPRWPTPYGPRAPICNGAHERITDVLTDDPATAEDRIP